MDTVYIETTIVSYLVARPGRDLMITAHQQATRSWWEQRRIYQCVTSEETLVEAARGDGEQARLRLGALAGLPVLPVTPRVADLAAEILASGSLPSAARSDAVHLAVATIGGLDFLLTWNCRHLANPHLQKRLRAFMAARALALPEICTPIELAGEWNHGFESDP
jgi:predicted nucleic acid-binding protein